MKNLYLLLICVILASCEKANDTIYSQPKRINVSGAETYHIDLEYSGNNVTSYKPSNGSAAFNFTYNSAGELIKIAQSGPVVKEYEIIREKGVLIRTKSKIFQNGAWEDSNVYTYSRDDLNNAFHLYIHNPENTEVLQILIAEYFDNQTATVEALSKTYTWKNSPNPPGSFFYWYFPELPVLLMDLPYLTKETTAGQEYVYTYEY